jgi:hypothetical protein
MEDTLCIMVLMKEQPTELHVNGVYLRGAYHDMHVLQMLIQYLLHIINTTSRPYFCPLGLYL